MQSEQFQLHCEIERKHWWFVARRQILRTLVHQLVPPEASKPRQATVIDVGCGTGANIAEFGEQYHAVGIEPSATAIQLAAQRFSQVDFRAGYAPDDLSDCISEAKLVMLNDVLEHIPDDFDLLSRLMAATRPGTYFLLTVPASMALWSPHDEAFGHYRRYESGRFRAVWDGLPVDELLFSHFNTRLWPIVRGIRMLNQMRGTTSGSAGTDFSVPNRAANRALTHIFAGERHRLGRLLAGEATAPYRRGVSLITVLRRRAGAIDARTKPPHLATDPHDPTALQSTSASQANEPVASLS